MKKYLIVLTAIVFVFTSACNNWLEIKPTDQISDNKVFDDSHSVRNALIGIYDKLSRSELYGRNLSWEFTSIIGRDYKKQVNDGLLNQAHDYNYEDYRVKAVIKSIWESSYSVIANANKIINEIETKDSSFFADGIKEKEIILSEAKAIRAFMYFDLIRLFAPAPITGDDKAYIPYYDTFGSKFETKMPSSKILEKIVADLAYGEEKLAKYNIVEEYSSYLYRVSNGYLFFNTGMFRFNYFAVIGLLSKVHMYNNNKLEAKRYAKLMIENYGPESEAIKYYEFDDKLTMPDLIGTAYKLPSALLLCMYNENVAEDLIDVNYKKFYELKDIKSEMEIDPDDCRLQLIVGNDENKDVSDKWKVFPFIGSTEVEQMYYVPAIRLSELYFILSECLWEEDKTASLEILNKFRVYRGAKTNIDTSNDTEYYNRLTLEYRKEFFTEGQMFYYFKRRNINLTVELEDIDMTNNFVLPIPDEENTY